MHFNLRIETLCYYHVRLAIFVLFTLLEVGGGNSKPFDALFSMKHKVELAKLYSKCRFLILQNISCVSIREGLKKNQWNSPLRGAGGQDRSIFH